MSPGPAAPFPRFSAAFPPPLHRSRFLLRGGARAGETAATRRPGCGLRGPGPRRVCEGKSEEKRWRSLGEGRVGGAGGDKGVAKRGGRWRLWVSAARSRGAGVGGGGVPTRGGQSCFDIAIIAAVAARGSPLLRTGSGSCQCLAPWAKPPEERHIQRACPPPHPLQLPLAPPPAAREGGSVSGVRREGLGPLSGSVRCWRLWLSPAWSAQPSAGHRQPGRLGASPRHNRARASTARFT